MNLRAKFAILLLCVALLGICHGQNSSDTNAARLIIRCDDIGFCHGVNLAFKRVADLGMVSKHRQAEADVLCDANYKSAVQAKGICLVGYKDLLGKTEMKRPFVSDKYVDVVRKALEK